MTEITQADITDTRAISELCGIVTGTVTEMDFSQFAAQFATYYAEFKEGYETDMEAWKALQEQSFTAWEVAEKADFDEWFANLHYVLDGDVAGHLQNEIDALAAGSSGSIFRLHTINSSLIGKQVTATSATDSKTEVFDENGDAVIKGMTDIGLFTFTSTDGTQTARSQLTIPYYGNYPVTMAFWAAIVNIHTDSSVFYEQDIKVIKNNVIIDTIAFDASGDVTYTATSAGTYRFRVTYDGQNYEVEQVISEETTYNLTLNAGLDLASWITAGSTTDYPLNPSSYANFAALEADKEAIRQLMLVHNAVDYLATANADDALIADVINSDICAKWISLSDYAMDTLEANANIKSVMDTADKYGYGEWGITDSTTTPPTWGALGCVPVMTANNAPYGTAISDANYAETYQPYFVFMTNPQYGWLGPTTNEGTHYIGYKFVNPVCVRKVKIGTKLIGYSGNAVDSTVKLRYSNDGSTWTELDDSISIPAYTDTVADVENDVYALYWAIRFVSWNRTNPYNMNVCSSLQFYGRELTPLVPAMTGNTTPKGECISSGDSMQGSGNDFPRYYAFDNNSATYWLSDATSVPNTYIGYKFSQKNKICGIGFVEDATYNYDRMGTFKVEGSDTGDANDWHDISGTLTVATGSANKLNTYTFNGGAYKYVRAYAVTGSASYRNSIGSMQFYGSDYSEKEFAQGSTRKTIYDHGIWFAEKTSQYKWVSTWSGGIVAPTENSNDIAFVASADGSTSAYEISQAINQSEYNLIGCNINQATAGNDPIGYGISSVLGNGYAASTISHNQPTKPYSTTRFYLDISNNSGNGYLYVGAASQRAGHINELWLE